MAKTVGTSVKRVEDPRFLRGQGTYTANLQLPGMTHLAVKRSPHAHAIIKRIDATRALALPGVLGVFTGKDLIEGGCGPLPVGWSVPNQKTPERHALMPDRVRHVGDGVAAVVAESSYIARDALDLIEVEYETLPVVTDARKAAAPGAPLVHQAIANNISYEWELGDKQACADGLAEAHIVVEQELINSRLVPNAIEPRACVAQWNAPDDHMTIWTTSQNPHPIRVLLSAFTLKIPEHKLRVIAPDVGGGFGSKIFHYPEEVIVPWVARKINRPVKWVGTRSEAFITDSHGRDHVTVAKMGFKRDGTITALHVTTWANQGAYLSTFASLIPTILYLGCISGMYKVKGIFGHVVATFTNTVPVDAVRGAGRPEAAYLVERMIDIGARRLKKDPWEVRHKNFIPASEFPYQTPVAFNYDSGDYHAICDKVATLADLKGMRERQAEARKAGRLVGIGFSTAIEISGYGPSKVVTSIGSALGMWESAALRVYPTGKVTLFTGSHSHGQGHETTFAQIAADELGIAVSDIEVVHGDTGRVQQGVGTFGSRSGTVGGTAVVKAAAKVREKMRRIAAHQLEAAEEDVVFDQSNGTAYVKGSPDKAKTFFDMAFSTFTANHLPAGMEPGLEEQAFFDPTGLTAPNSAHIAQVEVDPATGEVQIQRYVAVDDVGNVINPMIVEGQLLGGIVHGVGQALLECARYDSNGQLLSGSMMDYAMPRSNLMPMIETGRTVTPAPSNPLGVKGAGEMGTIASTPAICNAVMDALQIDHLDMPLTAERIWQAMQ